MRIHSDILSATHIVHAVHAASDIIGLPLAVATITRHGSHSRHQSFDVFLTGHGRSGGQWGNTTGLPTASWDDWGMVMAQIYKRDPGALIGPYKSLEHFDTVTMGRYGELTVSGDPVYQPHESIVAHHNHRWTYAYQTAGGRRVFTCKGTKGHPCSALQNLPPVRSHYGTIAERVSA